MFNFKTSRLRWCVQHFSWATPLGSINSYDFHVGDGHQSSIHRGFKYPINYKDPTVIFGGMSKNPLSTLAHCVSLILQRLPVHVLSTRFCLAKILVVLCFFSNWTMSFFFQMCLKFQHHELFRQFLLLISILPLTRLSWHWDWKVTGCVTRVGFYGWWLAWLLLGSLTTRGEFFGGRKCQLFGSTIKQPTANLNHLAETRCFIVVIVTSQEPQFSKGIAFLPKSCFLRGRVGFTPLFVLIFLVQHPSFLTSICSVHFRVITVDQWISLEQRKSIFVESRIRWRWLEILVQCFLLKYWWQEF